MASKLFKKEKKIISLLVFLLILVMHTNCYALCSPGVKKCNDVIRVPPDFVPERELKKSKSQQDATTTETSTSTETQTPKPSPAQISEPVEKSSSSLLQLVLYIVAGVALVLVVFKLSRFLVKKMR